MNARVVACPTCSAPAGERCVDLSSYPLGWRGGARGVLFPHEARVAEASPRFVTTEGDRLHRLAQHDLDGTLRSRCGLSEPSGYLVPPGDSLLVRLVDCGNCARSLGSVA